MEAFLISAGVVTLAEIGDKTQLLALMLAARYRAPLPIILGILVATILNHTLAAWFGAAAAEWIGFDRLKWILGVSFLAMAAWVLVPDKVDDGPRMLEKSSAFIATTISFFLVEIGDKTQVATVALAARFSSVWIVAAGTTAGMMIADVPAVFLGGITGKKIPLAPIRIVAAALFLIMGIAVLVDAITAMSD